MAIVETEVAVGVAVSAEETVQKALASIGVAAGDDTISYIVGRAIAAANAANDAVSTARTAAQDAMAASAIASTG